MTNNRGLATPLVENRGLTRGFAGGFFARNSSDTFSILDIAELLKSLESAESDLFKAVNVF